jgi:hypothetical protein
MITTETSAKEQGTITEKKSRESDLREGIDDEE